MRIKDIKLKTKTYKNTEIEIQKIPMRKTRSKQIIKGTTRSAFTSRAPGKCAISSIYNSSIKREAQTQQDGRSTNSMTSERGREWQ